MTTTPMSLRLAMAAWSVTHDDDEPWEDAPAIEKHPYMLEVDAILREMLKPSEGVIEAMETAMPENVLHRENEWRAAIQHIIDEPQD